MVHRCVRTAAVGGITMQTDCCFNIFHVNFVRRNLIILIYVCLFCLTFVVSISIHFCLHVLSSLQVPFTDEEDRQFENEHTQFDSRIEIINWKRISRMNWLSEVVILEISLFSP